MPELPEVEHVRRHLHAWMHAARITAVDGSDRLVIKPNPTALTRLVGQRVRRVERRGKRVRLLIGDELRVFLHLGMTGDWQRAPIDAPPLRFERVRLDLARGRKRWSVRYVDARRLGRVDVLSADPKSWIALGPDALTDGVDARRLAEKLAVRKKQSIKEALLDQTILAGIGNIQATEALWRARIDPRAIANRLDDRRLAALARAIRWSLDRTLADLARDALRWQEGGGDVFVVYGRNGEPCKRCRTPYRRIELGGRTTTFCPSCQRR